MSSKKNKRKYIFLGDTDSINIEIITKSHSFLKKKVDYIVIGNKSKLKNYLKKLNFDIKVNSSTDPINFGNIKQNIKIFYTN